MDHPFTGLSAFPLTPTDTDGRVDEGALARIIDRIVVSGAASIGLLGSTGIYAYLSPSERKRAVEIAVEAVAGRLPLIVGCGAIRTDAAIELARQAEAAGADALLMAPVSYTPLLESEVADHYAAVADATGLPLCIYNNPSTTHFTFSPALLSRIARHRRIVAVKMPLPKGPVTGDLPLLRRALPDGFSIGYSADWGAGEALLAGCDAFYSAVGGTIPEVMVRLAKAARRGDVDEVRRIDGALQPLWKLCREFGSLRVSYALARLQGLTEAEPPLPLQTIDGEAFARTEMALTAIDTL